MAAPSIDDILDTEPQWDITWRVQAIEERKTAHVANGGHPTTFYTAVTDVIYYRIQENPEQAAALHELLYVLHSGIPGDYAGKFNRIDHCDDFFASANVGLWKAIKTYEPGRASFASWAYMEVRKESHKALREKDHRTLSETSLRERPKVLAALDALQTDTHTPTDGEIAAWMRAQWPDSKRNLSPRMIGLIRNPPRIDSTDAAGDWAELAMPVTVEDEVLEREETRLAWSLLAGLSDPTERFIAERLYGFHGKPWSLQAVSDVVGLSREGVRQVLLRVEARWRDQLLSNVAPSQ